MAFVDLQANQMVDENNASTGGFTAIGPKNPGNQCYTKAQALAAYNLNASNMSAYASNQLVPKSVWASGVVGYAYPITQAGGTAAEACAYSTFPATFYSNVNTLAVGSIWYTDPGLTNPVSGGSGTPGYTWHQVQGSGNAYRVGPTGVIEVITSCTATFTPYNYPTSVKCYPNGGGLYIFEVHIDVYGAPSWNTITGGTIQVTQGSSGTNGIKNILHVGGTVYQCQSVGTFNAASSVSMSYCVIGVSDGSTGHSHTFTVPVSFNVGEINASTVKTTNVNVT